IATPGHALYGQHLSKEDADAFLAPDAHSLKLVRDWLASENLGDQAEFDSTADCVVVVASVEEAERLLKTEYSSFVDKRSGRAVLRTLQYSVPDILASHIDVIEPTTFFGMKRLGLTENLWNLSPADIEAAERNCTYITPACLSNLYNYGRAEAYSNGLMGIAGFINESASPSDLSVFMKQASTQHNADQSFTCVSVNGGKCTPDVGTVEANLDVQYARAMTRNIPNVFYSTGGTPPVIGNATDNEPYLEFLHYLLALRNEDLPNTLSISYGDVESSVPRRYAVKCCDLFAKLGARGVSVLVASGDSGAAEGNCPNGRFEAGFPASCPWVTAVGGTVGANAEKAWAGSGGGFSALFPRPEYQSGVVNTWLKHDKTHAGQTPYFNASGRAYPDVSALASAHLVIVKNKTVGVYGTSASAPVVAALVQLLNSDRMLHKKKPLGFLNPWMYYHAASAMKDISNGSIQGCNNGTGFQAVPGWDPTTGFGTPDFEKLLSISRAT
ncbi:hypothetical protein E4U54_005314, partial [Claviceps lovelessii]